MKYVEAFDIASSVIVARSRRAKYPSGAAREMALAAVEAETEYEAIAALSAAANRLEIPVRHTGRWDGSIA